MNCECLSCNVNLFIVPNQISECSKNITFYYMHIPNQHKANKQKRQKQRQEFVVFSSELKRQSIQ